MGAASTFKATLPSASLNSRSRMTRLVTLSPSVPASGESLTMKVMESVGGSIGCACKGSVTSSAQSVSATLNFSSPAMATMSPASASSIGVRSMPRKARIFETRPCSTMPAAAIEHFDRLVRPDRAGKDPPGDDAPEIGIGLEQGAEHAKAAGFDRRLRHMAQHEIEQRRHALVLRTLRIVGHPALLGRTVDDREIELLVGRVERGEKVEHFVDDLARAGIVLVDLVDADDRPQPDLQRLADDEFGLRHRPFGGIDEDDRAIDHRQDALDLAAEIGVAGRVDDIDPRVLPDDRGRLGENGDAALALEIVRIHHPFGDPLVLAERAGLLEQAVDERGLAVVDMRDDGDVTKFHGIGFPGRRTGLRDAPLHIVRTLREHDGVVSNSAAPTDLCGAIHEIKRKGKGEEGIGRDWVRAPALSSSS